jgi:hypothetical protein
MKIYNFDPKSGEYLSISIADPSPLEPGQYLIPAHATDVPPLPAGERETCVYRHGAAVLVPDWRGYSYWLADGTRHTITILDVCPPAEALDTPPPAERRRRYEAEAARRIHADLTGRDYDSEAQLAHYAARTGHRYQKEAKALQAWIVAVWDAWEALTDDDLSADPDAPAAWAAALPAPVYPD